MMHGARGWPHKQQLLPLLLVPACLLLGASFSLSTHFFSARRPSRVSTAQAIGAAVPWAGPEDVAAGGGRGPEEAAAGGGLVGGRKVDNGSALKRDGLNIAGPGSAAQAATPSSGSAALSPDRHSLQAAEPGVEEASALSAAIEAQARAHASSDINDLVVPASATPPAANGNQSGSAAPRYSFKTYAPGSQAANWRSFAVGQPFKGCSEDGRRGAAERHRVPHDFPLLLLIGQQKAGTTWLYDLLSLHPAVATGEYLDRPKEVKEVHWLDGGNTAVSWDQDDTAAYMRVFTKGLSDEKRADFWPGKMTALDATPVICAYKAAARAAALMPHARIVVVLRDPVARLLSHHRMHLYQNGGKWCEIQAERRGGVPPEDCPLPPIDEWLEQRIAADRQTPELLYPVVQGEDELQSFPELFCGVNRRSNGFNKKFMCSAHIAPQLAWWLAFFPPQQILILTSDQLHDAEGVREVGRQVLEHAGLHSLGDTPITPAMVKRAHGFVGPKPEEPDISHLIPQVRALFQRPMAELTALINEHWPGLNFTGIPDEL